MDEDLLPQASAILAPKARDFFALEARAASGEDADAVHDMRVASRRLRAAMTMFEPLYPQKRFARCYRVARDAGRALGALRDIDVLSARLSALAGSPSSPEELAALEEIQAGVLEGRAALVRKLRTTLDSLDLPRAAKSARALFAYAAVEVRCTPALAALARETFDPRVTTLFGFLMPASSPENGQAQHAARVAAKKLRYAAETLACCLNDSFPALQKWTKNLQDALGDLHDQDVLLGLVAEARQAAPGSGSAWPDEESRSRGMTALEDRLKRERRVYFSRFARLSRAWPESRVRALIDAGLAAAQPARGKSRPA
jgi:CHAD domain-containing protein